LTLSNSHDRALQLHWVCFACFNVQYSKSRGELPLLSSIVIFWLWDTIIIHRREIDVKARGFRVNTKQWETNKQRERKACENKRWEIEKLSIQNVYGAKSILKLVWEIHEVARHKVHYHEIEVSHMPSRFRRIMNWFSRIMKLVEHADNIGRNVHEIAWNLQEFDLAILWSHLIKGVKNRMTLNIIFSVLRVTYTIL
jgi:hypothetical protein